MICSDLRSSPSRGVLFAVLAGALAFLAAAPASAKKKRAADSDSATSPAADDEKPAQTDEKTDQKPAAQASDVEKPKPILDTSQEAPKTDSLGHVHFSSPNGEGLGRVVVNAPAEQKVKVFLEGRFFGTAPVSIFSVPKGDYILEASYPSGKQISKPVTVSENQETAIDLGGPQAGKAGGSGGGLFSSAGMTPSRSLWMKGLLIGGAAALVFGVTFGILEIKTESDYENTPKSNQAQLDSLQTTGQRDATLADLGYVVAAVAAIAGGICALPLILGPGTGSSEKPVNTTTLGIAPMVGGGTTGGALFFRF
jgi:hypothetical protein